MTAFRLSFFIAFLSTVNFITGCSSLANSTSNSFPNSMVMELCQTPQSHAISVTLAKIFLQVNTTNCADLALIAPEIIKLDLSNLDDFAPEVLRYFPKLRDLDVSASNVKSLEFVALQSQLISLIATDNQIASLPLIWPPGIEELSLASNLLTRIEGIQTLAKTIRTLDLSFNQISAIDELKSFSRLESLGLENNRIEKITSINSNKLTSLWLGGNPIKNFSPLRNLTSLTVLQLRSTGITDLAVLEPLENLEELSLSFNGIIDAAPLKALKRLKSLDLSWNKISDNHFIAHLPLLTWFNLKGNPVDPLYIP